jgi:hypothetical protein
MTVIQDRPPAVDVAEDGSPCPRFAGARLLAVSVAVVLSVMACLLWFRLPHVTVADHWSLAWVGLDVATASTAVMTALLLRAGDPRAALSSVAGAALLILDAWFDVCTATPGPAHVVAVLEATLVELPVAGLAIWLALRLVPRPARGVTRAPRTWLGTAKSG